MSEQQEVGAEKRAFAEDSGKGAVPVALRHAAELVAELDEHLTRFRYMVTAPAAISVVPTQEVPIRIELVSGSFEQACMGVLTWYNSSEEGELIARRTIDGGTIYLELRGTTYSGVPFVVAEGVRWYPGRFPSLAAGQEMIVGAMIMGALARDRWEPTTEYPVAVAEVYHGPGAHEAEDTKRGDR